MPGTPDPFEGPLLRSIPKADPFHVPDGFFDKFPQVVQQRVQGVTGTRIRTTITWWPRIAIGSLGVLAVVLSVWLVRPASSATPILTAEPEELLENGLEEDLLLAATAHVDLLEPVALPDDDAVVMAYLENEELPLDLLIEEL